MLAADLQYPGASLVSDFTLQAQSGGAAPVLRLLQTGTSNVVTQVTLSVAGDSTVNVRASDLMDLRGDTLRIDMNSLSLLNTFVSANGGSFTVVFDGGLDISTGLPLPVFDDAVRLEGTGAYSIGFGFNVQSSSDITIAAGSPTFSGAFSARSIATTAGKGDTTDLTKVLAVPQTAIAMANGKITATNITLQAVSTVNVQINSTTPLGDSIRFGTVVVVSNAKVDVAGSAQLAASGSLVVDATSNVTTAVQRKPQADGNAADDKTSDASIAISIVDSNAEVHIGGTSIITVGGTATLSADNTNNITSVADGIGGTSNAGGTLATAVVAGGTKLMVDGTANVTSAGNMMLRSRSNRTATTRSIATPKGVADDGNASTTTKGEQTLADNDASTSEGAVKYAAAIAVASVTGDTTAKIVGSTLSGPIVHSTGGTLTLLADESHNSTMTADGTTTDGSSDSGVGIAVSVSNINSTSQASVSGTASLRGSTITVDGRVTNGLATLDAMAGRKGSGVSDAAFGLAGSLAIAVNKVDAIATITPSANLTLNSTNLILNATANTTEISRAIPQASGSGSIGIGASFALNINDHTTSATLGDSVAISNLNNLSLTSTAVNNVTTQAKAGAAGGLAIAASVALTIANEDTVATLGSGNALNVLGALALSADHRGVHETTADGGATNASTAAIGGVFSLAFVDINTKTTTARDLSVTGTMTFVASDGSSSNSNSTSTAGGNDADGGSSESQSKQHRTKGDSKATSKSLRDSTSQGEQPKAETSSGPISIAAAFALNMLDTNTSSQLPSGRTVTVGSSTDLRALSNTDGSVNASSASVGSGSLGIAAAVSLNRVNAITDASIAGSTTLNTKGLTVEALMRTLGAEVTNTMTADATSGSGSANIGIAGSASLNLIDTKSTATIASNASVIGLSAQPLIVRADNRTDQRSKTKPKVGSSSDFGLGASFALNRIDNTTTAQIADDSIVSGTPSSLTIDVNSVHASGVEAEAGAASSIGIGAGVGLSIVRNTSTARLGSGTALALGTTSTATATIRTTATSAVNTKAHATAVGSSVGIGASVGIADIDEISTATLARDLSLGGVLIVNSNATNNSIVDVKASAKGSSSNAPNADAEASKQRNQTPNTSPNVTLPNLSSLMSSASGKSNSNSSVGSSSLGIVASLGVNIHDSINKATIESSADVTTLGSVIVSAVGHFDATTKATGSAVTLSEANNIGAGAALTFAGEQNRSDVSSGSTIRGGSITVESVEPAGQTNDFVTWGAAAGGGRSDIGIAGSLAINSITNEYTATANATSQLKSTGNLTLRAESLVNPQTVAAGGGFSSSVAAGAAVAIGNITSTTLASLGGNADAANAMIISAKSTLGTTKADLPLLTTAQDPTLTSMAVAGGVSSGNVGVAGAVVVSDYSLTTQATVAPGLQLNKDVSIIGSSSQSLDVRAEDITTLTSFAGSLGVSFGAAGVGAGLDLGLVRKDTRAVIGAGANVAAKGNISVVSINTDNYGSLSANAGIGTSVGIAGSATVYIVDSGSRAFLDSTVAVPINVNSTGSVSISATGAFTMTGIGASIGFGGTAGVGAGNFTLAHTDNVLAYVGDGAKVAAGGSGLSINATSTEDLVGVSSAAAGGLSAGVAGSATVIDLTETTSASIGRSAIITSTNGALAGESLISVTAFDKSTIVSVAGSLAGSITAAFGFGADVATITKSTTAKIDSGSNVSAEGNIIVTADSSEDITSVAAGVSISGYVSQAADAAVHVLDITTRAWIGDDARDAIASAGAGQYTAGGSIVVAADDRTEIDKVVGLFAAGVLGGGIAAAVGASSSTKLTEAFVGAGTVIVALGNFAPVTARTGDFTYGTTTIGVSANTSGIEPGSVSLSSSASGLSASGEVGLPKVGAMDVDRDSANDATDASISSQRTTVPKTRLLKGLSVTATNRDDIEVYTISYGVGLIAVAISAGVNVLNNQTLAAIGSGAQVNQLPGTANSAQEVLVGAGSDLIQTSFGGTFAGGGSKSPAVGVTVVKENTLAEIGTNAKATANADIIVNAFGSEKVLMAGTGFAVGLGFGAAVGQLTIDNQTTARVASGAKLLAVSDVVVTANDDTNTTLIAGAVAVGGAGLGASIGVVTIDKNTTAIVDSGAIVDALAVGSATPDVLTGTKSADGSFVRGSYLGLIVQSTSNEKLNHFAVAAAGAAVTGVAGGVAVTIVDSNTFATIGANARINQNIQPSPNHGIYVNAANRVDGFAFAGALASGAVGVSGAVNIASIRNDTLADIAGGAKLYASKDVAVNSLSTELLKGYAIGGASGAVGLAASVSVWSIGSALDKNYSNENNSGNTTPQTANALEGTGGQRADSDAARQAQESSNQSNQSLINFDKDSANTNQSSTKRVGSLTSIAASKVSSAAPTQAALQAKIDAAGAASGTTARISSGATVVAGDAILVNSNAGLTFTQVAGAVSVGAVAVGAGITVNTIASNSTAQAGGTLTALGRGVYVTTDNGQTTNATGFAGAASGFVGLGAAVAMVNDRSVSQALISDNAIINSLGAVNVTSRDNRNLTNNVASVAVGALAVGAGFARIKIGNDNAIETQAAIGNGASVSARSIALSASPVIVATANTTGLAGGALAASVNFAFVDAQSESRATIGASTIFASNEIEITSLLTTSLKAKGTGVALGLLGAAGMMYADVHAGRGNSDDEVVAGLSGAASIRSNSLTIRANSNDTLLADSTSGSGGTIVLAGSIAKTTSDIATNALIGDGAFVNVNRFGLYTEHRHNIDSVSDAITYAAASGQGALAANENTGKANISVGANAIINSVEIYVKANNDLVKNKADTSKAIENQFRNNVSSQSFSLVSLGLLKSDSDIGTDANPFQAVVSFGAGSKVKATGRPDQSGVFEISTNTNFDATDRVNIEGISLVGAIAKGNSIVDAVTLSSVVLNGAALENDSGSIGISSLSNGNNHPNTTLLVAAGLTGSTEARVRASTKATNKIDVVNSSVKALDVTLSSGKFDSASAVGLNSLDNHATARVQTASILPSSTLDSVVSTLIENNYLTLSGNSKIVGIRDVNLNARNGFSSSKADGAVYNYSAVPYGHGIDNSGAATRDNQINIGNSVRVEAGAGSNLTYTIQPMTFSGATFLTPDRLNTSLTAAEKTSRQLPQNVNFVFAPLSVSDIRFTVQPGYVMHLVNGAFASGIANGYYKFLPSTTDIVPHLESYADTSRWKALTQSEIDGLTASDSPVYESDVTKSFAIGLTGKYFIVKPADTPLPTLSLRNIGNLLLNQRDQIISWMAEHAGDAEAIARYEAQLIAIDAQLEDLGLLDAIRVNGKRIVKKNLDLDLASFFSKRI